MQKIALKAAINAARQAVLTRSTFQPMLEPKRNSATPPAALAPVPVASPEVITINSPAYPCAADVASSCPAGALSRGAAALWELLHGAAVQVARHNAYSVSVSQVTLALPHTGVAAVMGITTRHLYRLRNELHAAGLLASQGWADNVDGRHMHALTLWAVKTGTGQTTPRLTAEDFGAKWRNFKADLRDKNTVKHAINGEMSPLNTATEISEKIGLLAHWHVVGRYTDEPLPLHLGVTKIGPVSDAINSLGMLADCPPAQRRDLITSLAGWLADVFQDRHSFRWWCGLLWGVVGQWEHVGALQAKLQRCVADFTEWDGIRNPRAWLNARVT